MQQTSMLILGAGSDLGRALADAARDAGVILLLAARQAPASSGSEGGRPIEFYPFDVGALDGHAAFLDGLPFLPDIVVCMVGYLGDHSLAEVNHEEAGLIVRTNYWGPVSILGEVAARMDKRGHGAIVGVSSVAGDRGRADNYYYGSAKAGFTTFLSGLRQRFGRSSVRIVTIKPGRLRTKMTAGMDFGRRDLAIAPERIAPALLKACLRGRGTVYLPWYWRPIMALVRAVPESLFRRLPGG